MLITTEVEVEVDPTEVIENLTENELRDLFPATIKTLNTIADSLRLGHESRAKDLVNGLIHFWTGRIL